MIKSGLSGDAKAVLGGAFIGICELHYGMIENRPPARMAAALAELVKAGMIVEVPQPKRADGSRALHYKACVPTAEYRHFALRAKGLILAEPIT
jgi:hypothetical protein